MPARRSAFWNSLFWLFPYTGFSMMSMRRKPATSRFYNASWIKDHPDMLAFPEQWGSVNDAYVQCCHHAPYTKGNLGLAKLNHCLAVGSMEWGYYGES